MTTPMHSKRYGPAAGNQLAGFRVAPDVTSRAILDFLEDLDSPRSLTVAILFRYEEYSQIVSLPWDPFDYNSVDTARSSYIATEFLSKYKDFPDIADRRQVALERFEQFEASCKSLNVTLRVERAESFRNSPREPLLSVMARKISTILGDVNGQEILDHCDWGPGASTMISSRRANPAHKFQYETGITRKLYDLLCPFFSMRILEAFSPLWSCRLVESGFPQFQQGNKVTTVDKNSKTDRVIAIEPGFNIWFQKGIGSVMRRRLAKFGVDLAHQSINQDLSRIASRDGLLATIDFSSASDSIAYELVKELLPEPWFELLDCARSYSGSSNGKNHNWEKFSSMGNGYTFELETLIFYTLATSCAERLGIKDPTISVYGDDVIIPCTLYSSFQESAELLGFSVNHRKSHVGSPFRESCGAHWFSGSDIKPVYLKSRLHTIQSVYRFANAVRRLAHRWNDSSSCAARFRQTFYRLVYSVPKRFRFSIPNGFGDGGFIMNFDEAAPKRAEFGIEGYLVKHVVDHSIPTVVEYDGLLLARLKELEHMRGYSPFTWVSGRLKPSELSDRSSRNNVTTRDHTSPRISSKGLVPSWYNLGLWI